MLDESRARRYALKTVCLCAPSWAEREWQQVMAVLTAAGAVVIGPAADVAGAGEQFARWRLTAADVLLVVNVGGYVTDPMTAELALALRLDVCVEYLEPPVRIEAGSELGRVLAERESRYVAGPAGKTPVLAPGVLVEVPGPGDVTVVCRTLELDRDFDQDALAAAMSRVAAPAGSGDLAPSSPVLHLEYVGAVSPRRAAERAYRRSLPRTVAGAHVLIRDGAGRMLLVRPTDSSRWSLPGGGFDEGEYPWQAAQREAIEELGFAEFEPGGLLVIDQCPARAETETHTEYLFDGGVIDDDAIAAIRLPADELDAFEFVDADRVNAFVTPRLARRILGALERLRDPGAPVALEHGYRTGERAVWRWHAPDGLPDLPVGQVGGWLFDEESGRVLLQHRTDAHRYALPAGGPEAGEQPLETLAREAMEESQVEVYLNTAVLIGGQSSTADRRYRDGVLQLRYAAVIRRYHPIAPDGDPHLAGRRPAYRRFLVDIERAAALLDFGPSGHLQAVAAKRAAIEEHGLPVDRPAPDGYRDHGDPQPHTAAPARRDGDAS